MFVFITPPFLKAQLYKQNYHYAAACSFQRKIIIHNWVWRLTWVEVVLYCMNAAQNKREGCVKAMYNVRLISLWVLNT